jgi:hypothetical protein
VTSDEEKVKSKKEKGKREKGFETLIKCENTHVDTLDGGNAMIHFG